MLVALSEQIIIIFYTSVSGIERMIQRFEVTATGINVCGIWDMTRNTVLFLGHFLAYRAFIHDSEFVRG